MSNTEMSNTDKYKIINLEKRISDLEILDRIKNQQQILSEFAIYNNHLKVLQYFADSDIKMERESLNLLKIELDQFEKFVEIVSDKLKKEGVNIDDIKKKFKD